MINVNKDRAVEAMSVIETHPDRHDQGAWRTEKGTERNAYENFRDDPLNPECGTAGCLAGWVAFLDGVRWAGIYNIEFARWYRAADMVSDPDRCTCPPQDRLCTCGNYMTVNDYASQRLGIDVDEANALFDGDNDLSDLREGVKALMNGENVYEAVHMSRHENDDDFDCGDDDCPDS